MAYIHVHLGCDEDTEPVEVVELDPVSPEEALRIEKERDCFREDALYFDTHREEFLEKYPEQWVAVYQTKVVAVADALDDLFRLIDASGAPRTRVYVDQATEDDEDYVIFLP